MGKKQRTMWEYRIYDGDEVIYSHEVYNRDFATARAYATQHLASLPEGYEHCVVRLVRITATETGVTEVIIEED